MHVLLNDAIYLDAVYMKAFIERHPLYVTANPGGADDPLGESILDHRMSALRVFEPRHTSIVIGRNQNPHTEIRVAQAQADAVPIYRRVSGGGTVVLTAGTVVLALRLRQQQQSIADIFTAINGASQRAVAALTGVTPVCRGHGDLALRDADGSERKIVGASLRQTSAAVYYLGVFLVEDCMALIDTYLPFPSKQPAYRDGRTHSDFCTHLSTRAVTTTALIAAVQEHCADVLASQLLMSDC